MYSIQKKTINYLCLNRLKVEALLEKTNKKMSNYSGFSIPSQKVIAGLEDKNEAMARKLEAMESMIKSMHATAGVNNSNLRV